MNTLLASIGAPEILLIGGGACISLMLVVLWIQMIVNCIQRLSAGDNRMIAWLVVLLLTYALGALIYRFTAYRRITSANLSTNQ